MMKKTIVFGLLSVGAVLFFMQDNKVSPALFAKISSESWDVRTPTEENLAVLGQDFSYIGRGAQAYVFESADGKSVLKFFRKTRFAPPYWMRLLPPLPFKVKKFASKRDNVLKDFTSYQIAFNELQEETGLLLVHLDKTTLQKRVTLECEGKRYHVNLGDYSFILQKKGELVYSALARYVKEGNLEIAKESLTSLVHLLKERCDKKVADRDPNFSKNYAFIGTDAIEIDIGRFSHAPIQTPKIPAHFTTFLQELSPQLHAHFEQEYAATFSRE